MIILCCENVLVFLHRRKANHCVLVMLSDLNKLFANYTYILVV